MKRRADASDLNQQFQDDGFVPHSFDLADPSVLPTLLADTAMFDQALAVLADEGRRAVPYIMTEAIAAVAHDTRLVRVVEEILETDHWVMWGPNIRRGTPNQAHRWHVDLESLLWPSVTVVIGVQACTAQAATWLVPGSAHIRRGPTPAVAGSCTSEVLRIARSRYQRCRAPQQISGFGDGRFYLFNAGCWHRGDPGTCVDRIALFLHFQCADAKRIPYMLDYDRDQWSRDACPYIVSPAGGRVNRSVYRPPLRHVAGGILYRLRRKWL